MMKNPHSHIRDAHTRFCGGDFAPGSKELKPGTTDNLDYIFFYAYMTIKNVSRH